MACPYQGTNAKLRWATHDFDLSEVLDALRGILGGDLVREAVSFMYSTQIEAEPVEVIGAEPLERCVTRIVRCSGSRPDAHCQGRRPGVEDSQAAPERVLPKRARAAPSYRPGPLCRGHGGLRPPGLDAQGRRPRQGDFTATSVNELWLTDFTEHRPQQGSSTSAA